MNFIQSQPRAAAVPARIPYSVDELSDYLGQARSEGEVHSSGAFTMSLEQARAKLSHFGQVAPSIWSLKLLQTFQLLECTALEVTSDKWRWTLAGQRPARQLDPGRLKVQVAELAMSGDLTAEQCLATALVALPHLAAIQWSYQGECHVLWGEPWEAPGSGAETLVLALVWSRPFPFPGLLWRLRGQLSPMELILPRRSAPLFGADAFPALDAPPVWLEAFFVHHAEPRLAVNGRGRVKLELGLPVPRARRKQTSAALRSVHQDAPPGQDALVLLHPQFAGATRFFPVQAGCLLDPLQLQGFPDGLTVMFAADALPVDLSQFRLRDCKSLQERLGQLLHVLPRATKIMLGQWEPSERLVKISRTPPLADVPPILMAMFGLGILGSVFSAGLSLIEAAGVLVAEGIFLGFPAIYYKVSRGARKDEHLRQLFDWREINQALHDRLLAFDQEWQRTL